ncbi:MAG: hypothetical protein PHD67_11045 [Oscillospiraceae bacterium]|nr:hypothetical protein [Oscillospiraceae bacterium]
MEQNELRYSTTGKGEKQPAYGFDCRNTAVGISGIVTDPAPMLGMLAVSDTAFFRRGTQMMTNAPACIIISAESM